jgi:hypothetical protein
LGNCAPSAGSFIQNTAGSATSQASANFNIQATDSGTAGTVGGIIRAAAGGQTADLFELQNASGTVLSSFTASGDLKVASSIDTQTNVPLNIGTTNASQINLNQDTHILAGKSLIVEEGSTTALQVLGGIGSTEVLTVDTTGDGRVTIGANGGCTLGADQGTICYNENYNRGGVFSNTTFGLTTTSAKNDYINYTGIQDTSSAIANNIYGYYVDAHTGTNSSAIVTSFFSKVSSGQPGNFLQFQNGGTSVLTADNTGILTVSGLKLWNSGRTFTATLGVGALTQNVTYNLPVPTGASDTICLLTLSNCSPSGASFIQNGTGLQTGANFNIDGIGIAATLKATTGVQTPLIDTASAAALNIGTTNATAINLNQNTTVASGKTLTVNGGTLIKTTSATAFQIQNGSSQSVLTANTSSGKVILGQSSALDGSLVFSTAAGANTVGLALQSSPSSSYTLLLPATPPAGGQCIKTDLDNPNQLVFGSCITPSTPQFVQQVTNSSTASSSLATTIPDTVQGHMLIAIIATSSSTASVSSVTDTAGNTWVKATSGSGSANDSEIWYAANSSPVTQVTVNLSASYAISVNIVEFDGMAATSPLDVASGQANANGKTFSTPSATTTVNQDLIIGSLSYAGGGSVTATTSGWNSLTMVNGTQSMQASFTVRATGAYSFGWSSGASIPTSTTIAAFKPAGSSGADYAEMYGTTDSSIGAGDVIALDTSKPATQMTDSYGQANTKAWIKKATTAEYNGLLGVVSTNPGQTVGNVYLPKDNPRPVALAGRIPVKVNDQNGPILPGDFLVPSSTPGVAMKAIGPGMSIGQAMSGWSGSGQGTVIVFVNNTYYPGSNAITLSGDATGLTGQGSDALQGSPSGSSVSGESDSSSTQNAIGIEQSTATSGTILSGAAVLTTLTVTGNVSVEGNLEVAGTLTAGSLTVNGQAVLGADIVLAAKVNTRQAILKSFVASKAIAAGSVVILDDTPGNEGQITTTTKLGDTRVIGIAVTEAAQAGDTVEVAVGGSVQVRVDNPDITDADGQAQPAPAITPGELLISSDITEGSAIVSASPQAGTMIGKTTSQQADSGMVWVLVTLQ